MNVAETFRFRYLRKIVSKAFCTLVNKKEMKNVALFLSSDYIEKTCTQKRTVITIWNYATESYILKVNVKPQ
jgi:hypothetical protein